MQVGVLSALNKLHASEAVLWLCQSTTTLWRRGKQITHRRAGSNTACRTRRRCRSGRTPLPPTLIICIFFISRFSTRPLSSSWSRTTPALNLAWRWQCRSGNLIINHNGGQTRNRTANARNRHWRRWWCCTKKRYRHFIAIAKPHTENKWWV